MKIIKNLILFLIFSHNLLFPSALITAIKNGDLKKAEDLINTRKTYLNAKDWKGNTALIYACSKGYKKIATILINKNVDINAQNNKRINAFQAACINGQNEMISLLSNTKIDINSQSKDGFTGLIYACGYRHKKLVTTLINLGANINIQDSFGCTALHSACDRGESEIVEILINANIDTTIKSTEELTAFDYAQNFPRILSLLQATKENRFSNCDCYNKICFNCKNEMSAVPLLANNKSNLNTYLIEVKEILKNNKLSKKIKNKILKELIECNDQRTIKFKNKLRLLNDIDCDSCNALLCRECKNIFN